MTAIRKYTVTIKPLRTCWGGMISRCYNPKNQRYRAYGARGVRVCREWLNSYQSFLDWALANGWQKGLQLDKDIKGNGMLYSPKKCCFVTKEVNMRHQRHIVLYPFNGQKLTINQVGEILGIPAGTLADRIKNGMSFKKAISQRRFKKNMPKGANHPNSKLLPEDVLLMRIALKTGVPRKDIMNYYLSKASRSGINNILRNETYTNV
jgi:hypothetical protein